MMARAMASLSPTNRLGSAKGKEIFQNERQRLAPIERFSMRSSGGMEVRPRAMSTTTGKNAIRTTMMIFGV